MSSPPLLLIEPCPKREADGNSDALLIGLHVYCFIDPHASPAHAYRAKLEQTKGLEDVIPRPRGWVL